MEEIRRKLIEEAEAETEQSVSKRRAVHVSSLFASYVWSFMHGSPFARRLLAICSSLDRFRLVVCSSFEPSAGRRRGNGEPCIQFAYLPHLECIPFLEHHMWSNARSCTARRLLAAHRRLPVCPQFDDEQEQEQPEQPPPQQPQPQAAGGGPVVVEME
jgi:hypothetical protein